MSRHQTAEVNRDTIRGNRSFENVVKFEHLGTALTI
jgi:hypothetical protein